MTAVMESTAEGLFEQTEAPTLRWPLCESGLVPLPGVDVTGE